MFAQRLADLINEKGLTKKQFLKTMQFGKNQFRYWETTGSVPNQRSLIAIADFLDVSVDYLLGKTDERLADTMVENQTAKQKDDRDEVVIYRRDGRKTVKRFTPEQMRLFERLLDAIDAEPNDEL